MNTTPTEAEQAAREFIAWLGPAEKWDEGPQVQMRMQSVYALAREVLRLREALQRVSGKCRVIANNTSTPTDEDVRDIADTLDAILNPPPEVQP